MSHMLEINPQLLARVRRIGGQVNAIERALESDKSCTDILHLVAAVRGAVNGLLDEIIAEHLEAHVARPGLSDTERQQGADELLAVIRRYAK
ncbi:MULTISPECIES: metal/formaldehyde-sensitive transcriptional repressor [unclassified Sphingobium]|uniref:metal/formaldehyde-sensitive transcriptional repressor n=1 Tax=unclassified Sphingobium TaxID=2611147 RepID=UPI002224BCB9|nr:MULTISPECIES: metal/formaldehyde-sensitive transcriptional repressor [unclassified Sphingobium]MCW2394785.1 DNA-binding FrmR family transcriptional regulator [Sphingobium sp. B8D3B]MCW2418299.1 DNA-binding FrmR family transcriptional regulator [Sphingobium sp. B8D3C]